MASKKITFGTQSIVFILIIFGFIAVVNYLASKKFARIDLTENKMYSISSASKNLLKDLDDIVNINVYFSKNLPPHLKKLESDVRDVLTEFKAYAGKNLHITWEDPSENEEAKRKVRALGIPEVQLQTIEKDKAQVINGFLGLAILYEDKKEVMQVIQNMTNFEYDLAQRIMKVFRTAAPKVGVVKTDSMPYFDQSMRMQMKGQLPPDPTEEKYMPIFEKLRENYDVVTVDVSGGAIIDGSIKTLIVPGGDETFFTERTIFEIDQFFMQGGNLIVLAEAIKIDMSRGLNGFVQSPKILKLLEQYGVRVEKSIVLDASCGQVQIPQQVGPFRMNVPVNYPYIAKVTPAGINKDNPAVSGLSQMIFPWASPLTLLVDNADSPAETDSGTAVKATILIQSSEKSWVESGYFNLNPQQDWNSIFGSKQGELKQNILVAYLNGNFTSYFAGKSIPPKVEPLLSDTGEIAPIKIDESDRDRKIIASNTGRHLIVTGDSDFLSSQGAAPGNVAWLLNVVDWLTLDDNLIAIRSRSLVDRTIKNERLGTDKSYANTIRFLNIFIMPILVIILGLFIFFKRREVITASPTPSTKESATKQKEGKDK